MNKYIILTFFLFLNSCSSSLPFDEEKDVNCYWMENYSGKFEWVSTQDYFGEKYDKKECFGADSCDGGLGKSGGGCYKWAKTANGPRLEWDKVK
jgi:hypothetical protein